MRTKLGLREKTFLADFFRVFSEICLTMIKTYQFIRRYKEEQNIGRKRDLKVTQQEDEQADI